MLIAHKIIRHRSASLDIIYWAIHCRVWCEVNNRDLTFRAGKVPAKNSSGDKEPQAIFITRGSQYKSPLYSFGASASELGTT
jgi:hypothetical protein